MRSIHIKASREYDVLVERGLLDRAGELLREVSAPGMAAIVSDNTVYALYGERTVKALEKASRGRGEQEPLDLRRCAALPR